MGKEKKRRELATTQIIVLGFLITILVGTALLTLPVSSACGTWTNPVDALFTSTTSVCVTGLTVVDTYSYWSTFGQVVILLLIQCGGLGIITFTSMFILLLHRKMTLKDRLLLADAFNLGSLSGLLPFLRSVVLGTLLVEGLGALLSFPVFIRDYSVGKAVWMSVFHSISAFCNAGLDLIGSTSMIPYADNLWLNLVTMALIILGGIGFIVWWDVRRVLREIRTGRVRRDSFFSSLNLHTKLVLTMTAGLILGGWLLFLVLEWNNPATLGGHSLGGKLLRSLFQSVTTRTAGFATVDQTGLTSGSVLLTVMLMFIGGSSVGTAGGIKTTTMAMILLSARSTVQGRTAVTVFGRTLPQKTVQRALAVFLISFATLILAAILLCVIQGGSLSDVLFETASALGTVGLTRGVSGAADVGGKILLSMCMYFGRVGPISLAIAFAGRTGSRNDYPERDVTIG